VENSQFTHRQLANGSWQSICMKCFLTVIMGQDAREESDLQLGEQIHVCGMSRQELLAVEMTKATTDEP